MSNIHSFPTPGAMAEGFATLLKKRIDEKEGNFYLAISGGSTPQLLFYILATSFHETIDWSRVHLFWSEERCVEPEEDDSNYGVTYDLLLRWLDMPEENIHRIRGEEPSEGEVQRYEEEIREWLPHKEDIPHFDMIMLGLGSNGRLNSINPEQLELLDSESLCTVSPLPQCNQDTITFTLKLINHANSVAFLVTGSGKAGVFKAITEQQEGHEQYPAAAVQPKEGELLWFVDKKVVSP